MSEYPQKNWKKFAIVAVSAILSLGVMVVLDLLLDGPWFMIAASAFIVLCLVGMAASHR